MRALTLLLTLSTCLFGCYDKAYGPKVINGAGQDIKLIIQFESSGRTEALIPPCRTVFLGKKNDTIKKISVEIDGHAVQELGEIEIKKLVAIEEEAGFANWIWVVDALSVKGFKSYECS